MALRGDALAAAPPVAPVGIAGYPHMLGVLTIKEAAAGPGSPRLLTAAATPMIPILVGVPALCRWACRRRPDVPAPTYW